ncbi:MAG: hypothetical protein L3K13_05585 [Thermoplasmata archaeon]|nr:hypothetical protein [Thermoplasmata archaeon]
MTNPPADPASELERRAARLAQWAEVARPLGVNLPELPRWAAGFARTGEDASAWAEVLRGIERVAQRRILLALEGWGERTRQRLARLEAYSVDSRLEREEIDDVLHAARLGEVPRAVASYLQVDRVVALKERHLDQAREELERLVGLLRDMATLGLPVPDELEPLEGELERELRRGRLAPLKSRLRELRASATTTLKRELPGIVGRYGDRLVKERAEGGRIDNQAGELAKAAREFSRGRLEEALRHLRLAGYTPGRAGHGSRAPGGPSGGSATGAVRTA